MRPANRKAVRRYLDPGERVRLEARPHGAALVRPLLRALVLAVGGGALVVYAMPHAWPLGVLGALALAYAAFTTLRAVLAWDRTVLVVTSAKLLVVHGVVRRRAPAAARPAGGAGGVGPGRLGPRRGVGSVAPGDLEVPYVPDPGRLVR